MSKETSKNKFMRKFARYLTKHYAGRCDKRSPGCRVCELWAAFDLIDTLLIEDIDYEHGMAELQRLGQEYDSEDNT